MFHDVCNLSTYLTLLTWIIIYAPFEEKKNKQFVILNLFYIG